MAIGRQRRALAVEIAERAKIEIAEQVRLMIRDGLFGPDGKSPDEIAAITVTAMTAQRLVLMNAPRMSRMDSSCVTGTPVARGSTARTASTKRASGSSSHASSFGR